MGVPRAVDGDPVAIIKGRTADVSAVNERRAGSVDLGHERVPSFVRGDVGPDYDGEGGPQGMCVANDIGVPLVVDGDPVPKIRPLAAEEAAVCLLYTSDAADE